MKNFARFSFLSFVMIASMTITVPITMLGQSKLLRTDRLITESEVIVLGKVEKLSSEWTQNRERIQTHVTVSVDQTIKGTVPGNSITVIIPGGEVDGVGEWYSHSVNFQKDEDVVVFAKKERDGRYQITGGETGKFSVQKDVRTGARTIPNIGTLEAFTAKIKDVMKYQQNADSRN